MAGAHALQRKGRRDKFGHLPPKPPTYFTLSILTAPPSPPFPSLDLLSLHRPGKRWRATLLRLAAREDAAATDLHRPRLTSFEASTTDGYKCSNPRPNLVPNRSMMLGLCRSVEPCVLDTSDWWICIVSYPSLCLLVVDHSSALHFASSLVQIILNCHFATSLCKCRVLLSTLSFAWSM